MPQRIVDRLEAVEVQKQQRHPLAGALCPGERHPQPVFEQRAVGESGEPIVERELMHPRLVGARAAREPVSFSARVIAGTSRESRP